MKGVIVLKKIYFIWCVVIFAVYFIFTLFGINLLNLYLISGGILIAICIILDGTMVSGNQTRANFYLDRITKSEGKKTKIVTLIFLASLPLMIVPFLFFLINKVL